MEVEERVARYAAHVLSKSDVDAVATVVRFEHGDRHGVYSVTFLAGDSGPRDCVVRVSLADDAGEHHQAAREAAVLGRLDGKGAPKLYDFDGTTRWFGTPAMCIEFIDGERRDLDAVGRRELEALGSVVASVHGVDADDLDGWGEGPRTLASCVDDWLGLIAAYSPRLREPLPVAVRERVSAGRAIVVSALERAKRAACFNGDDRIVLLHGDVTAGNVLWSPEPVLIDWEYARRGDAADEIGYIFGQNAFTAEQRQAFWTGYRGTSSHSRLDEVAERVLWWQPVTLLASALWWLERWSRRADADDAGTVDATAPKQQMHYIGEALQRLDRFDRAVKDLPT